MSGVGTGFDHPAAEAVAAIDAALDALQVANLWSLPTAELGRLLVGLETTTRRIDAARRRPGVCPACGYDLRATPGRCPDCGAEPATPTMGDA